MQLDRRAATALVAGLGQFLVDHAEEVAAYVTAAHEALGGLPAAPEAAPEAKASTLEKGQRVTVMAHYTYSAAPTVVRAEVTAVNEHPGKPTEYQLTPKLGDKVTDAPCVVAWFGDGWRYESGAPRWLDNCFRIDVTVETTAESTKLEP